MRNRPWTILTVAVLAGIFGLLPAAADETTPYDDLDQSLDTVGLQLRNAAAKLKAGVQEEIKLRIPDRNEKKEDLREMKEIPAPVIDCCSSNLMKIKGEAARMRTVLDELSAAYTLENNAEGMQAVKKFHEALDALEKALRAFGGASSTEYANAAITPVKLVYGEMLKIRTQLDVAAGRTPEKTEGQA